jgi:hypothetical protein
MPRLHKKGPTAFLAMSPAMLAASFGLNPAIIYREIVTGRLELRTLPGTIARRVLIADAERWFRTVWQPAKPRAPRRTKPKKENAE